MKPDLTKIDNAVKAVKGLTAAFEKLELIILRIKYGRLQ